MCHRQHEAGGVLAATHVGMRMPSRISSNTFTKSHMAYIRASADLTTMVGLGLSNREDPFCACPVCADVDHGKLSLLVLSHAICRAMRVVAHVWYSFVTRQL